MNELISKTLIITGIGMLGIFVFMILFYAVIVLLDKLFPPTKV